MFPVIRPIIPDGVDSEISRSVPHQVVALNRVTGGYNGPADLSGFFRMAYDMEAFYIFFTVYDDNATIYNPEAGFGALKFDCIELYF